MYISSHSSVSRLLLDRAEQLATRTAFAFGSGSPDAQVLTYGELCEKALRCANWIRTLHETHEPVLLLLPYGPEYLVAFFACILSGAIPVPLFPARGRGKDDRLENIASASGAKVALIAANGIKLQNPSLRHFSIPDGIPPTKPLYLSDASAPAFLQYTSGSTGNPKGVIVTHENILANSRMIQSSFRTTQDDIIASWLPFFHDMGMVGVILQTIFLGAKAVLLSPAQFLKDPMAWIRLISTAGVTVSGGPNFGYELCTRYAESRHPGDINLTHWRVAFTGAEPIRHATIERFSSYFASFGFHQGAWAPCYGLAESTLLVSAAHTVKNCDESVSCGEPADGLRVIVVNPETAECCPEGIAGELWVQGASVAGGYWNDPLATATTFEARTADGDGPFLRTGDLAQVKQGEVFIRGRLKDILILNGTNYTAQDIEDAVTCLPNLSEGVVAAFGVDVREEECLILAIETDTLDWIAVRSEIQKELNLKFGITAREIQFVRRRSLPRTSSGKLKRHACRDSFLSGSLRIISGSTVSTGTGSTHSPITDIVCKILNLDAHLIDESVPLLNYGLDSVKAAAIAVRLCSSFGMRIDMEDLFRDSASLLDLTARLSNHNRSESLPDTAITAFHWNPASQGQRALFLEYQSGVDMERLHLCLQGWICGTITSTALTAAVRSMPQRHPSLGLQFRFQEGDLEQHLSFRELPVEIHEVSSMSEEVLAQHAAIPFDLESGSAARVMIWETDGFAKAISFCVHHIVMDLWSLPTLLRDLEDSITGYVPSHEHGIASFVYAAHRNVPPTQDVLDYWTGYLKNSIDFELDLPIPSDPGPALPVSTVLPPNLVEQLKVQCGTRNISFGSTVMAAFQIVMARWVGAEGFLIASPVADRAASGVGEAVGYFVNMTPFLVSIPDGKNFWEFAKSINGHSTLAASSRLCPLPVLTKLLGLGRIEVAMSWQTLPADVSQAVAGIALELDGTILRLGPIEVEMEFTRQSIPAFPIHLRASLNNDLLYLSLAYDGRRFRRQDMQQILSGLERVLADACSYISSPISNFSLADVIAQPSKFRVSHSSVKVWFEETAARFMNRVAVDDGYHCLTYGELNATANKCAKRLQELGIKGEHRVAILTDRTVHTLAAFVGITKSGAAYVPLDAGLPEERLRHILMNSGASAILLRGQKPSWIPSHVHVMGLDDVVGDPDFNHNPITSQHPESLLYVLYTSGSTGHPKGVEVTHGNVAALVQSCKNQFELSESDCWSLCHSFGFDFSTWEIWGCLLSGARLRIIPAETTRSPRDLWSLLNQDGVTILSQTPSAFRALIPEATLPDSPWDENLRMVVFGGEALDFRMLTRWAERFNLRQTRLVNMYGITETTVHVTAHEITQEEIEAGGPSLIGDSISGWSIHLLDSALQPAPTGASAEIYVGGAGVARGYHGRADLTAERFVPDPFGGLGQRLYRSGDIGRRTEAGQLQHLGRRDGQVKIRGHRIELGEVEAALLSAPGVHDAAVIATQEEAGARLLGYVVIGDTVDPEQVREHARQYLPAYMMPASVIKLDRIPLTVNGKLDRAALPMPSSALMSDSSIQPRTQQERELAEIWANVLGLRYVGIQENFFHVGGDSIRAITMQTHAARAGIFFSIADLYRHPTVEELCTVAIQESVEITVTERLGMLTPADRYGVSAEIEDVFPLTQLQAGMVFHSEHSSDYETYVTSLLVHAKFNAHAMNFALARAEIRHDILRTSVDITSFQTPMQIVWKPGHYCLQCDSFDLTELTAIEQKQRLEYWLGEERRRRPQWSGPLFRFTSHITSSEGFHFTLSEPCLDGWSATNLLTGILSDYAELLTGEVFPEPEIIPGMRRYVELEQESLNSSKHLDYWHSVIVDNPSSIFPSSSHLPELPVESVSRVSTSFPPSTLVTLQFIAKSCGVPLRTCLLAIHLKVLSVWTGATTVLTGLLQNGRPEADGYENAVGLFLNALPCRLNLRPGSWKQLMERVYAKEVELIPVRHYPLAAIQKLNGNQPLFNTVFNYTHFYPYARLEHGIQNIRAEAIYASEQTYFDLTVQFNQDHITHSLRLALDFRTSWFAEADANRILSSYIGVLDSLVSNPDGNHDDCTVVPAVDQKNFEQWNDTITKTPDIAIHQLIEKQTTLTPTATAVRFQSREMTYMDLNRSAELLASALQQQGVGPESTVGVMLHRSSELIVSLLAVLKCGACYLPLEPGYPLDRREWILTDSRPSCLISSHDLIAEMNLGTIPMIVPQATGSHFTPTLIHPQQAAYMIYTSGSTGQPKAAVNTHSGIVSHLIWMAQHFQVNADDRILQKTPIGFDVSVWELLLPLICGGTLVFAEPDGHLDPGYLARILESERITIAHFVPSMMQLFCCDPSTDLAYPDLRLLICSGEALTAEHCHMARLRFPHTTLYNLYGPAEAAIDVTAGECSTNLSTQVSIGCPVDNTTIHILDDFQQRVPRGVIGELYIGGVQVGRGYQHRPDLTAERFLPSMFALTAGERLYRTGDLARFRSDGMIEFLGRNDFQVKIHGQRIELGEIEHALLQLSEVVATAVIGREIEGVMKLVAYIQLRENKAFQEAEIRTLLIRTLPRHMVPNYFFLLPALPQTASGKIDRKALSELPLQSKVGIDELIRRVHALSDHDVASLSRQLSFTGDR